MRTLPNIKSLKHHFDKTRGEYESSCSKRPKTSDTSTDRRCHYCNKIGHLKRHCSLLRNNNKSEGTTRPRVSVDKPGDKPLGIQCSYCHKLGHSESTCFTKQREEKLKHFKDPKLQTKSINICSPSNDSLIEICLGGYNLQALIDSGSECSLIKKGIADCLPDKKEISFTRLTGIGSTPCFSFRKMTTFAEFDGFHTEITFVIVDSHLLPHDVILGREIVKIPGLIFTLNSNGAKIVRDTNVNICLTQTTNVGFDDINTDLIQQCDIDRLRFILKKYETNFASGNSRSTVNTGKMQIKLKNPDKIVQRHAYQLAPSE